MEYAGYFLIVLGLLFVITGSVGMLRFPDFFTRLHPAGIADSLAVPMCIIGLMFLDGFTIYSLKLFLLLIILFLTCPTACHAIAKAAYKQKLDDNQDSSQ